MRKIGIVFATLSMKEFHVQKWSTIIIPRTQPKNLPRGLKFGTSPKSWVCLYTYFQNHQSADP